MQGTTTEPPAGFQYIKAGEGTEFLKNPLFFISWTPDNTFFNRIPETNINWRVEWLEHGAFPRWTQATITEFQRRGMHYIGYSIVGAHQWDNKPLMMPECAAVDINGNPIYYRKPGMPGFDAGQYRMNILCTEWRELVLSQVEKLIDMGAEGINIDEIADIDGLIQAGGSFDDDTMTSFTRYLQGKYSAAELKQRFGIGDITAFNLKDYIKSHNMQATWNADAYNLPPVIFEFRQFQLVEHAAAWRELSRTIKEYGRDRYGREIFVSFNASPQFSTHYMATDFIDYLTGEQFYFEQSLSKAAVCVKMSEALSPRMMILAEVSHDQGTLPAQTKNLFKYILADVYSANGKLIASAGNFMTRRSGNYLDDSATVKFDIDAAAPYVAFASNHPEWYGLEEPAEVCVVNSIPSSITSAVSSLADIPRWTNASITGITEILLNLNIPSKIITSGDEELITKSFTLNDLQPYKAIILPQVFMISDGELQALLQYAESGGAVIQIGSFATHDKQGTKINPLELQALRSEGTHQTGSGSWTVISQDIGADYSWNGNQNRSYQPAERMANAPEMVKIAELLSDCCSFPVQTDAPPTVNIRRYVDGSRVVLHMVNYNYSHTTDRFTTAGPFKLTVALPSGMTPAKATLYEFEGAATTALDFTVQDSQVTLTVPSLYAYSVLELQ